MNIHKGFLVGITLPLLMLGTLNAAKISSNIEGVYERGEASIRINSDLTFVYDNIDPNSANMCNIMDEKFIKKGKTLFWQSEETDCKIEIKEVSKKTIKLTTSSVGDEDSGCSYYCGMGLDIEDGEYTKSKK